MTFLNSVTASENCLSMKLVSVTDIEMEYRLKGGNQFLYVGMKICSHGELCMPTLSEKKKRKQQHFRFSGNELKFTVQNYIFH